MSQTSERPGAADSGPVRSQSLAGGGISAAPSLQGGTATAWTTSDYGAKLYRHHAELLMASAVAPAVSLARDYRTVETKAELGRLGFGRAQQLVPTLLVPVFNERGDVELFQHRPDAPRRNGKGQVKYETPSGAKMVVDVPPAARDRLADPAVPLFVTEGVRKADAAVSAGLCCVALLGVWNWRGSNSDGGKTALAIWESVALKGRTVYITFDSDVMLKKEVNDALVRLGAFLGRRGARVGYIYLPTRDGGKVGLDDYLAGGGKVPDLVLLAKSEPLTPQLDIDEEEPEPPPRRPEPKPRRLDEAVATFRNWLHLEDAGALYTVAGSVVANLAPGDPVWTLVVAPPSTGKTEMLSAVAPLEYVHPVATLTEAALLSGTGAKERARNATGGVLRQVGEFGILLSKDFTSVLAQNRDTRGQVLAALREVYDGSWSRAVGTDGGQVMTWIGKAGFIGGVTPAFDRYHGVVSSLGDRFLMYRLPDADSDKSGKLALAHVGREAEMRKQLADAMTGLITGADLAAVTRPLREDERDRLVKLAGFAARARTAVERDGYTHDVLVIPQAEGPGRLVTALRRLYGGLEAIGVSEEDRWTIVSRVAIHCAPAGRMQAASELLKASAEEKVKTSGVATRAGLATKTASQYLDDLAMLGLAERAKTSEASNAPDLWSASDWLRERWPQDADRDVMPQSKSKREKQYRGDVGLVVADGAHTNEVHPYLTLSPTLAAPTCTARGTWTSCANLNCQTFQACVAAN
jgi:Domain of unknown function (DUF3854)